MEKKIVIVFEVLVIVVAVFYYYIKIFIPEYREKVGSSDSLIKAESYNNMVEISIDNNIDFSLVWDENGKIYHMFFFSKSASCLYSKGIEGNSFEEAISLTIQLLVENDYLKTNSSVKIIRYGNDGYKSFVQIFNSKLNTLGVFNVEEYENTLQGKSKQLGLGEDREKNILLAMDIYSKEKGKY